MNDVGSLKMAVLLDAYPEARAVLLHHGVDPLARCHRAATHHMTLRQVLGRTCPVDDVAGTLADLAALIEGQPREAAPEQGG